MSPRGVLSRNVVRNGVRGALATRRAVRAREGVTFLRLAVVVVVHVVIRVVIVVRANLPNILLLRHLFV